MKRTLSFIITSVLSVFAEGRMLNSLSEQMAQRWHLEKPYTIFVDTDNMFTMDYGISDFMSSSNTRVEIFTEDCAYPTLFDGIASKTLNANGALVFEIEPEILSLNDKVFNGDGYPEKGVMKLCLRYMLWTGPETDVNAIEVNFRETILTIEFNMQKGFEFTGFSAVPRETDGDKNNIGEREGYDIKGYLCDPYTLQPMLMPKTGFSQGEFISICAELDEKAALEGLQLNGVDYFFWAREFTLGGIPTTTIQHAIQDNAAANMLTEYNPPAGGLFCSFRTMLFSDFYTKPGVVSGEGQVSMGFGSLDRRHLVAETNNIRGLQQQQQDSGFAADSRTSIIDISIPVTTVDDRPGFRTTAGGASYRNTSVACVVGSFVSVILLVVVGY